MKTLVELVKQNNESVYFTTFFLYLDSGSSNELLEDDILKRVN